MNIFQYRKFERVLLMKFKREIVDSSGACTGLYVVYRKLIKLKLIAISRSKITHRVPENFITLIINIKIYRMMIESRILAFYLKGISIKFYLIKRLISNRLWCTR